MKTRGLSIVEVVIALVILTIVLAGLLPSFIGNLQINNRTELRGTAVSIAERELEQYRRQNLTNISNTQTTSPTPNPKDVPQDGRTYQVNTRFCVDTTRCSGNARQVVVQVNYQGSKLYEVETVYTQLSSAP